MKFNPVKTAVFSLSMLVLSTVAVAEPHNDDNGHNKSDEQHQMHHKKSNKKHQRMMHMLEKSGVSEQILADIKTIHASGLELRDAKHQEIKTFKTKIRNLSKADDFDEQALRDLLKTVAEKKADLMIMHINKRHEVKALLNDEQKAMLEEMHQEHSH